MIEKMKMVHIVTTVSRKEEMLEGLRDMGLLHLAERKSADRASVERFATLSKTAGQLTEYAPKKQKRKETPILSDEAFETMYSGVLNALEKKVSLAQTIGQDTAEIERVQPWGEFSPESVKELRDLGFNLHFYRVEKAEWEQILEDEEIRAIRLAPVEKTITIAVIGTLPPEIRGSEFQLPEKGIPALRQEIEDCRKETESCNEVLRDASVYEASFRDQMLKAQNRENYSSASATAESDADFVWLSGYVPAADIESFRKAAAANNWAWAAEDVAEDDEAVPTKLRYNKLSKLIQPLYSILGILPGYREQDISLWFLMFFTLFFAMIIGDGGYGLLILLTTVGIAVKTKKMSTPVYLLGVLSIATIVWGGITGTWFGMEGAMKVPFLRHLVLPGFANYPEFFNVTASQQQNNIMKFSFTIGAIQMELGTLLAVKKKLASKDLSLISDIGWMISIVAMYLLSLYLVIGQKVMLKPIFIAILAGFILVVLFGGMAPDKTFAQGLKAGLADAFTTFLNTISCFGNVMSYIRLFAVGMAGLAIAQSFNGIAAGLAHGPLFILAIVVVLIGHALNIVMCFLSVVVHGVRLNVLEFSGQVGLEWTGIAYEPFKKNDKIKK
ncbi:V-type ATP synthase subunit I [Eubacterium pyruvativorans]|uniref:V-type ATP synthase subunit I n=1 Tax=Eubacterium pyruvativorans TaxID=155865 RepID=UPI0023EFDAB7|nr:hypothetical protein [Eubacterium pyruvativorans]MDD7684286.1 hypothetical protein [Eubacterium pyruvativorans]